MARKPQITRTMHYTECEVLFANTNDVEVKPYTEKITLYRKWKTEKSIIERLKEQCPENIVPIRVKILGSVRN